VRTALDAGFIPDLSLRGDGHFAATRDFRFRRRLGRISHGSFAIEDSAGTAAQQGPFMGEVTRQLGVGKGVTVTYRVWRIADEKRPVIVLLHGVASNLTRWSEFLEHTTLKSSWDILRVDLRGHGQSMCRRKVGMEIWCRDLLRVLDAEDYPHAVLVGHSLGAQLAIHFAHEHPARVRGVVLIDPILGPPLTRTMRLKRVLVPAWRLVITFIRLLNRLGLHRRHIPERDLRALDEKTRAELLAAGKVEEMVRKYRSPWPDLKHFPTASFLEEMIEIVRPLPSLASIAAPVLVVLSRGVTYVDPAVTRHMIGQFGRATTVAVDAHHWPLTERPVETREAIEKWCTELQWSS
jgi:pimeloyl-ACP methyl ester carboxylesterase